MSDPDRMGPGQGWFVPDLLQPVGRGGQRPSWGEHVGPTDGAEEPNPSRTPQLGGSLGGEGRPPPGKPPWMSDPVVSVVMAWGRGSA
eukprot:scaffold656_cov403-Pavlova_lutheri.AAC.45